MEALYTSANPAGDRAGEGMLEGLTEVTAQGLFSKHLKMQRRLEKASVLLGSSEPSARRGKKARMVSKCQLSE